MARTGDPFQSFLVVSFGASFVDFAAALERILTKLATKFIEVGKQVTGTYESHEH